MSQGREACRQAVLLFRGPAPGKWKNRVYEAGNEFQINVDA